MPARTPPSGPLNRRSRTAVATSGRGPLRTVVSVRLRSAITRTQARWGPPELAERRC